jgi:hypothetical protein
MNPATSTVAAGDTGAFVLVPFPGTVEASVWATVLSADRDDGDPPIIVIEGSEDHWTDPETGEPGYEVTFAGWRAKVAITDQVTIGKGARPRRKAGVA